MKKFRKLLFFAAMAALLTCLLCVALNAETVSGTCGAEGDRSNLTWTFDTETGVLKIEGKGAMADYYGSGAIIPWNNYSSGIESVEIGDGVISIGDNAFTSCRNLTSIKIPSSVTNIGYSAFSGCSKLKYNEYDNAKYLGNTENLYHALVRVKDTSITDCAINNSTKVIADGAFFNCKNLTSIDIPSSVTDIGQGAFKSCSSLTSVTIPDGVISIRDSVLYGCGSLTSIEIPNSVTSIGDSAFYGCSSLTSIEIPSSVTNIGNSVFSGCSSLTSINVDGINEAYKSIDGVLFSKDEKTLIAYPKGKSETTYAIPDSVTSIGNNAFSGCSSLTSIEIPSSVTNIGNSVFSGCSSLTSINVDGINEAYKSIDGVLFSKDEKTLIAYPKGKSETTYAIPDSVTSIGGYAFGGCSSLTSIEIPNSVTSIGGYAFGGCSSLTSIEIPNSVASIGSYAFYFCRKLTSVTFDKDSRLERIENKAFYWCSNLTSIEIPSSVTSIGQTAFWRCSSLASVTFDKDSKLERIESNAFLLCSSLTSIEIPSSVTCIESSAFSSCSSLISVTIFSKDVTIYGVSPILTTATIYGYSGSTAEAYAKNYNIKFVALKNLRNIIASGTCGAAGDNLTWSLDDEGLLTIEGSGAMKDYLPSETVSWEDYLSSVKSVEIGNGVTSIGDYAFNCCSNLTKIKISSSVTSIGCQAISFCDSLTSIIFSENSRLTTIKKMAFLSCSSLTSIKIPSGVTSIGDSAFHSCSSLTSIIFSENSQLTSIGNWAFIGCSSLTSITIPSSVISMDGDFNGCSSLASINVDETNEAYKSIDGVLFTKDGKVLIAYPAGKIETTYNIPDGVTTIRYHAFYRRISLTNITIPNSVTSIENYAFGACTGLTSITIPSSVTSIGCVAFVDCDNLTSITILSKNATIYDSENTIPEVATIYSYKGSTAEAYATKYNRKFVVLRNIIASETCGSEGNENYLVWALDDEGLLTIDGTGSMSLYTYYFGATMWRKYCEDIKTVEIKGKFIDVGAYAFESCNNLTSIKISDSVTRIGLKAFDGCSSLTSITIPSGVTSIGAQAFCGCSSLASIEMPSGVTSIGVNAFRDCSSLTKIEIPSSVTSIGDSMFQGCSRLTSIAIPNGVTSIGVNAFYGCSRLTSIAIPNGVTSIGVQAFWGCGSLTSITISDSVTSIGDYAFYRCSSLESINVDEANETYKSIDGVLLSKDEKTLIAYPNGKSKTTYTIPSSVTSIASRAFGGCSSLTGIDIPNGVTSIGDYAFAGCNNLTSITIPNSVTSIGAQAFQSCSSLTSIEIPNSVTSIGAWTFDCCVNLTSITIPDSVTSIGDGAFFSCCSLTSITIPNSVVSIGGYAFRCCYDLESITIPSSVTSIDANAFDECIFLKVISIFSKDVEICDSTTTISDTATIYGYSGSTAEAYAAKYNRKFVAIDKYNSMNAGATLNENITMNFVGTALTKEDVDGNDFKMTFVMNGSKTSVSPVEKNGKYTFPFAGIAPQCMNDEISYEMTMNGAVVKQGSISVSGYLKQLIEKKPANMTDAKFKAMSTLVSDMLNYGSAAQAYTGHGTDSLLNENYYDDIVNKYTELESTDKALSGAAPAGAKFTNVGVRFDNVNKVFFRFTADDVSNVIITINGVAYGQDKFVKTVDKYTVYSEDILASKFDTVYTAILTYIGTDEKQMMTYSVKSFAYSFQNKRGEDGKLTAEAVLARATYTYGVSARAYENAE